MVKLPYSSGRVNCALKWIKSSCCFFYSVQFRIDDAEARDTSTTHTMPGDNPFYLFFQWVKHTSHFFYSIVGIYGITRKTLLLFCVLCFKSGSCLVEKKGSERRERSRHNCERVERVRGIVKSTVLISHCVAFCAPSLITFQLFCVWFFNLLENAGRRMVWRGFEIEYCVMQVKPGCKMSINEISRVHRQRLKNFSTLFS